MAAETARTTTAAPETLWSIWSDPLHWKEWNPNVSGVELEGPFAVGTRGVMHSGDGRVHRIQFTDIQQGRQFTLSATALPGALLMFTCRIEAQAGGARISQAVDMKGPLAPIFRPLMSGQIARTFVPILDGLAREAEAR